MFKTFLIILSVATGNPVATLSSKATFPTMSKCQEWLDSRVNETMKDELRDLARSQFGEPVNITVKCEGSV